MDAAENCQCERRARRNLRWGERLARCHSRVRGNPAPAGTPVAYDLVAAGVPARHFLDPGSESGVTNDRQSPRVGQSRRWRDCLSRMTGRMPVPPKKEIAFPRNAGFHSSAMTWAATCPRLLNSHLPPAQLKLTSGGPKVTLNRPLTCKMDRFFKSALLAASRCVVARRGGIHGRTNF